jgi:hypothetical protein
MRTHHAVSDVARELNCRPHNVFDRINGRRFPDDLGPIVGGRRLISAELLPSIRTALTERLNQQGDAPCEV